MSLKDRIIANAPMRLDHYIEACLWDESDGYYATKIVFGTSGDFVTAPEISQIFGEIVGLWCVSKWHEMGAPEVCTLLELGAGRGVLMRDILRVAKADPAFAKAIVPTILEKSAQLRDVQSVTIGQPVHFVEALRDLPCQPTLILANEFFDALPIRQFRFEDGGWLEAYVDQNLNKIWRPCANPPTVMSTKMTASVTIELCEQAMSIAAQIGRHIKEHKGAILAIDYGDFEGFGDTLQAVKDHRYSDPLLDQGEQDLTAHVRFGDIAGASNIDPVFNTQAQFLNAYGGVERLQSLCTQNPALADDLIAGYHRLTAPDQMGELFKVLILENISMEKTS